MGWMGKCVFNVFIEFATLVSRAGDQAGSMLALMDGMYLWNPPMRRGGA